MDNQVEKKRNRLLRRADWRYLLSNPWPEKSICFNSGFLAQAVQSVSSQTLPANESTPGECDLAVATNPNSTTLQRAWQALCPGGSFYSEWYLPLAGGSAGIRKRLEAANFTNVVCYWPWPIPAFSSALFWLPLDAPHVIRYFLSSRHRPANPLVRFENYILQFLWKFARNTGLLSPICVTACKGEPPFITAIPPVPEEELIVEWMDGKTGGNSRSFDSLMWTGGRHSINKVILYQFAHREENPRLVVKLPRIPEAIPALTHEAHILRTLHARKREAAARTPAVLFLHETNDTVELGETVVLGRLLYEVLDSDNALSWAIKVTEWLASLVVNEPIHPRTTWWNGFIEPVLYDFKQAFEPVLDSFVIAKCWSILNRLGELPRAFEHRDCAPWNLLVTPGGELAVLDWESAEQNGLPALDLFYFLAYLAFFMDGAMKNRNFVESYRRAFDPTTNTGLLQATCQQRYTECTGLDPAVLYPLRLLTWLVQARSEVRRLSADAGGAPPQSALRRSLFYSLVLEELAQEQDETASFRVQ